MLILRGHVIKVDSDGSRARNKHAPERHIAMARFKIRAEDETIYDMKYEGHLPLEKDDYIVADASDQLDAYLVLRRPHVSLPENPDIVIQKLCSPKLLSRQEAELFYRQIEDEFATTTVVSYLNRVSRRYVNQKNMNITRFEKLGWKGDAIKRVLEWWHKHRIIRQLILLGPTKAELEPLFKHLTGDEIIELCFTNPSVLYSVNPTTIDTLVTTYKLTLSDDQRTCGEITRKIYYHLTKDGYICTPLSMLLQYPIAQLGDMLVREYFIKFEYDSAYLPYPYKVETYIADYIITQLEQDFPVYELPLNYKLAQEKDENDKNWEHRGAINHALRHPISAISGPAGSGKTSLIIELVKFIGVDEVIVTSFTGKAVTCLRKKFNKDLDLQGQVNLKTIDSLICSDKIPVSCVIIDEISMVTTELMYRFLHKYGNGFRLILVGDINQLPPIGWGSFMLEVENCIPIYRLEETYRTESPKILHNSFKLRMERKMPCHFECGPEFQMYYGAVPTIEELIWKLNHCVDLNRVSIICSSGKTKVGDQEIKHTKILNDIFQSMVIPPENKHVMFNGSKWSIGDRVMMTVNNWTQNLANGDEGRIVDILDGEGEDVPGKLIITFPDIVDEAIFELSYPPENLDEIAEDLAELIGCDNNEPEENPSSHFDDGFNQGGMSDNDECKNPEKKPPPKKPLYASSLVLAYAMTVHKSQGSEYDYVIVYLPTFRRGFSTRNLLYTAITRAKFYVVLVENGNTINSNWGTIDRMTVENLQHRHDNLSKRLPVYNI